MRLWSHFFLPVAAVLHATLTHAIYADEAYQTDYHHALLGPPQSHTTFFHRPSAASKASLLYTLSERLVLGAVNPKDGAVIWRQQLSDYAVNGSGLGLLKAVEGGDTLVSAVGGTVQSWDATDGRLVWAWKGKGEVRAIETSVSTEGVRDVFVLSAGDGLNVVNKLAADSGKALWQFSEASGDAPYSLVSTKDRLYYLSLHSALLKGLKIKVIAINPSTGAQLGQPILLGSDSEVTSEDLILHAGANSDASFLVWTDKALKTLKINTVGTKQITSISVPPGNGDAAKKIIVHASRSKAAQPHFLVHYQAAESHWAEVYHLDLASGVAKKAFELPLLGGKGAFSASSQGSDVYFTRHTEFEDVLFSSTSAAPLSQWNVRPKNYVGMAESQDINHAVSEVIPRSGSKYAVRSAIAFSSGHWGLIRNGEPFWLRHEYLSGTVAAAFFEIAKEEDLASELAVESQGGPLGAYVHRLKRHVRDLYYLPDWAAALPNRLLGSFVGEKAGSQDQSLRRDSFGFHKIVLIATEYGRLAALDAGVQGKVIWSVEAVTLKTSQKWEVLSIEAEAENTALIRGKGGEFLRVDSNTGKILQYQPGAMISSLKTSTPVLDTSGKTVLIPIKDDGSLGDLPKADFVIGTVVVTEGEDGIIRGWKLTKGTKASLVWQFLPAPGEKVHSVIARPSHDPVASIGKALGDRNVLYKYLNPNVLLVTAVNTESSTATFYLVESTSGAVIYSSTQPGVDISRPIVPALAENWLAYSLYSETSAATPGSTGADRQKLKGYQLVVSELYESPYPNDRGSLGSTSNFSDIFPIAADEDETVTIPKQIDGTWIS
ncbi:ER membrane protein complex subunit 1, partial [Lecanoromycetidae sp. Uapishka_2]